MVVVGGAGEHRVAGLGALAAGGRLLGRAQGEVVVAPADTQGELFVLESGRWVEWWSGAPCTCPGWRWGRWPCTSVARGSGWG